jgi:hypothetical protein
LFLPRRRRSTIPPCRNIAWVNLVDDDPVNEIEQFSPLTDEPITDANLFHLAPVVCLKFRDRKLVGREADRVTETALANYVVNSDPDRMDQGLESKPLLAFAVCYVIGHLALDLVDEKQAEAILNTPLSPLGAMRASDRVAPESLPTRRSCILIHAHISARGSSDHGFATCR